MLFIPGIEQCGPLWMGHFHVEFTLLSPHPSQRSWAARDPAEQMCQQHPRELNRGLGTKSPRTHAVGRSTVGIVGCPWQTPISTGAISTAQRAPPTPFQRWKMICLDLWIANTCSRPGPRNSGRSQMPWPKPLLCKLMGLELDPISLSMHSWWFVQSSMRSSYMPDTPLPGCETWTYYSASHSKVLISYVYTEMTVSLLWSCFEDSQNC